MDIILGIDIGTSKILGLKTQFHWPALF